MLLITEHPGFMSLEIKSAFIISLDLFAAEHVQYTGHSKFNYLW